jgi:tetratricopeptide (TPR) repeat protein
MKYFFNVLLILVTLSSSISSSRADAREEISYPAKAYSKLDTFEALNLEDADKLFNKRDYKGALAAYHAYSTEFDRSPALAYVLLRMGRCLHLLGKRHAAIKAYQDVVDYFPDNVPYAAGALFHMGEAHGQNGDTAKQTAVWARMVKDDQYVNEPKSGSALTFLAGEMSKLKKHDEAAEYQWRTAVAFRSTNWDAAKVARDAVLFHYAWRSPDHDKLMQFYREAGGFDGRAQKVDKPNEDVRYWDAVLYIVTRTGGEAEKLKSVSLYWSPKVGDRFVDNDELRFKVFEMLLNIDGDRKAWVQRMVKQYKVKPASLDRLLGWCRRFHDAKVYDYRDSFFAEQSPSLVKGLNFNDQMKLMDQLDRMGMKDQTVVVLRSIGVGGLTDPEIARLGEFAEKYEGEEGFLRYAARIKDPLYATKVRFDFYKARSHRNQPYMEKALAEIPELKKSPKYAEGMDWAQGELLQGLGRYDEAIKAYQTANRQPDSSWRVIDCLVALKQYAPAIQTARGLQSINADVGAQAAFKIADIYRVSGDKGKEVGQLRLVLKQYPKSRQSSDAHNRLESYGVALSGGESEAEE